MLSNDDTDQTTLMSIEEHKRIWVECEEEKLQPRLVLKHIGKKQRASTKFIREYMEENHIARFECGMGWIQTCEEVEKVTFSEDVCSSYMEAETLERLKKEQTTRRPSFKTLPPPKRQRTESSI
jgi:hypothetical protein